MVGFVAILHVAMTQCTLPSSIMTDNENDESFLSQLFTGDSDTSFTERFDQEESTLEEIFTKLDEEERNMNCNPLYAAMSTDKEKEESLEDRSRLSSSDEEPTPKKSKKEDDSSYNDDSNWSNEREVDEEELDTDENALDEDIISEKELDLPVNRNRKEKGKAVEPNHYRRNLERNMAAQGLYGNRDITELTSIVATSPRLKLILDNKLSKWQPSLPLLVRSTHSPR